MEGSRFSTHAELLEAVFDMCKVRRDETAVLLSASFVSDEELEPYVEALRRRSADFIQMKFFPTEPGVIHAIQPGLAEMLKQVDFVVQPRGYTFPTPFPTITAHALGLRDILATGTRWLDFVIDEANQRRLFPAEDTVANAMASAEVLANGKVVRITSDFGTDLEMRKDGRKGHKQTGIADTPGTWDNFGWGMVACAPLEDSANGKLALVPGDGLLQMGTIVEDPVTLTFKDGCVVDIAGGRTAKALNQWLSSWVDPDSFGLSHVGWGMQKNTVWASDPRHTPADGESYYGGVLMALGSNITEMGAKHSGLGGTRACKSHLDIPIRNHDFYVDGECVLAKGEPKKFI